MIVFRFSRWHLSDASEVMNEMNSETHSWTVSFASLAIFAFAGRAFFHYPRDVRDWEESVLLANVLPALVVVIVPAAVLRFLFSAHAAPTDLYARASVRRATRPRR